MIQQLGDEFCDKAGSSHAYILKTHEKVGFGKSFRYCCRKLHKTMPVGVILKFLQ